MAKLSGAEIDELLKTESVWNSLHVDVRRSGVLLGPLIVIVCTALFAALLFALHH